MAATGSERNSESTSYDKAQPENTYNHTRQQQSDYQSPVDLPGVQMSYKNGGLVNGGYANSATDLKQLNGATGLQPYSNAFYDEAQPNNTYNTLQRQSTNNVRPRAQLPRLNPYEEVGPETLLARQKKKQSSRPSEKVLQRRRRDRWIRVVLMCLIVVVATAALILTIMLMMGKIGPKCSCGSTGSSQTAQQVSSDEPRTEAPNTFQTNLSPLHDIVEDLEANLTALRAEAEALMKESAQNSDVLLSAKTEFNSTKDAVTPFSDQFQAHLTQIHNNFKNQFDGDIGPVTAELRTLNESKTNQLSQLQQKSEQDNDDIDMTARSMNDTITDKVAIKISRPGPIGERGENGSKGLTGERGQNGTKGSVGIKGPKGEKGLQGDPGDNGIPGSAGAKGDTGVKGPKGPQGAKGDAGAPGLDGPTGPRGIGNFSWCQWKQATVLRTDIPGKKALAKDTPNLKIVAAYCSTDAAREYNLQVTQTGNGNEYECVCMGGVGGESCILTYWECPIQAP